MKKAILATKVGMTQVFNEDGQLTPVTVLAAGPVFVTQVKTIENDGYEAVQVGFVDKKERVINRDATGRKEVAHRHGVTKAEMGHFKKAGVSGKRYVKEFLFENVADYKLAKGTSLAVIILIIFGISCAECGRGKKVHRTLARCADIVIDNPANPCIWK